MISFFEIGGARLARLGFNLAASRPSGLAALYADGTGRLYRRVPAWLRKQFLFAGEGMHEDFYAHTFRRHVERAGLHAWPLTPAVAQALLARTTTVCHLDPDYLGLLFELGGPTRDFLALPGAARTVRRGARV